MRHPGPVTRAVHGDQISAVTTVPRGGMNYNIQTVYGPTNNWQTVGKHRTWTHPKRVFGKKKSDENLSALPRRYTVVLYLLWLLWLLWVVWLHLVPSQAITGCPPSQRISMIQAVIESWQTRRIRHCRVIPLRSDVLVHIEGKRIGTRPSKIFHT